MTEKKIDLPYEFAAQILTTGYWPTYPVEDVTLPKDMATSLGVFINYYNTRTSHRRVQWLHSLGTITLLGMAVLSCASLEFGSSTLSSSSL